MIWAVLFCHRLGNDYDDFDCNTSLYPCGIRIWTCLRKYTVQICKYTDSNSVRQSRILTLSVSTSVTKLIESQSQTSIYSNRDLHSRSRRNRWKDVVGLIANTLLRRVEFGFQIPQKNLKSQLATPREISNFSVVFESHDIPSSFPSAPWMRS